LKETGLGAKYRTTWTVEQARCFIDSIEAFGKGKMRMAGFRLSSLINKIVEGKKAALSEEVIMQAKDQRLKARILWEYWTTENSDGFHDSEFARGSPARSGDESLKGIRIINDALVMKTPSAAPAPAAAK